MLSENSWSGRMRCSVLASSPAPPASTGATHISILDTDMFTVWTKKPRPATALCQLSLWQSQEFNSGICTDSTNTSGILDAKDNTILYLTFLCGSQTSTNPPCFVSWSEEDPSRGITTYWQSHGQSATQYLPSKDYGSITSKAQWVETAMAKPRSHLTKTESTHAYKLSSDLNTMLSHTPYSSTYTGEK